jgi:hypothetical protein
MKYGQTFQAQSVPQWAPCEFEPIFARRDDADRLIAVPPTDNLDYNELKNLIKVHTTKDQGQAIAIPGKKDAALAKFEDLFFNELANQHDRVDLFVKDKAGEIARRLGALFDKNCWDIS